MHITAITLSYDQVARIIEAHINAELLRTPHRVTRVDPWDWDAADEHQFAISLEPLPQQPAAAQPDPVADFAAHLFDAPAPAANGNGHARKQEVAPEPSSAETKRKPRTTDAQRERVLAMLRIGGNRETIAEACGVAVSAVYKIRAAAIAAGQLDAA